ncbi:MAG: DUF402 domain-containing protein [Chloroflexota bacterium]
MGTPRRGRITVHKMTYRGEYVTSWDGEVVEQADDCLVLSARWTRPAVAVGVLTFEPGDVFLEYYYPHRPYSLWGVYDPDAVTLKGWYCNVGLARYVDEGTIEVRDLILDVLVLPDGRHEVLDRDEFAAAGDLPADLAATAESGVAAILALVAARTRPFDALTPVR